MFEIGHKSKRLVEVENVFPTINKLINSFNTNFVIYLQRIRKRKALLMKKKVNLSKQILLSFSLGMKINKSQF